MEKIYNKLVRDRIPEIIAADGKKCRVRALGSAEMLPALAEKLKEEAGEFSEAMSLGELADVEEVVLSLMSRLGVSEEDLKKAVLEKRERNGGFEKNIFLESVED